MTHVFHIIERSAWSDAQASGVLRPASLATEGFVHFSFAEQVADTAARHYPGVDDLCVLEVDPDRLPVPVVVEDSHDGAGAFPHVYGEIPVGAVVAVRDLPR